MTPDSQHYLGYVIDLEAYSLVFRPREHDTEFMQIQRAEYTADNAELALTTISDAHSDNDADWSLTASMVFVYLLHTERLCIMRGQIESATHWFVQDHVSQQVFDFTEPPADERIYETAKPAFDDSVGSMPTEACFDLLERLQPTSPRYPVDQHITPENQANSDFIAQKRGMDYLYQNGVFGKFDKF